MTVMGVRSDFSDAMVSGLFLSLQFRVGKKLWLSQPHQKQKRPRGSSKFDGRALQRAVGPFGITVTWY